MQTFDNIPHVQRKIYERTFMNEIVLFFSYEKIDSVSIGEGFAAFLNERGVNISIHNEGIVVYKFKDAAISITTVGTLLSIPSREYKDFSKTKEIWEHVEDVLSKLCVIPVAWAFTKGNRFVFSKPISEEKHKDVFNLILSKDLLDASNEKQFYVKESIDHTCVFSCRYGIDKVQDKDCLSLKIMITSVAYSLDEFMKQIFNRNEDMFDCWRWCINENAIAMMEGKA